MPNCWSEGPRARKGDASRADFAAGNESTDQHMGPGSNRRAGTDIREPGIGSLIQVVNFGEGDASSSILPADDGSVISSGERSDERRFPVV